jgi:hypothetical protein
MSAAASDWPATLTSLQRWGHLATCPAAPALWALTAQVFLLVTGCIPGKGGCGQQV